MSSMNVMNVMNVVQGHQGGKLNFYPRVSPGNVHDVHNVHEAIFGPFWGGLSRFRPNLCGTHVQGIGGITE